MSRTATLLYIAIALLASLPAAAQGLRLEKGQPSKFLDLGVHLLAGGSYETDNYMDCYPEITDLNTSMGASWGAGARGKFNFTRFLGLCTEINATHGCYTMDMAVVGAGGSSVSNVYERNSMWRLDFPVYMRLSVAVGGHAAWNIDCGLYYSYGVAGTQRTRIYNVDANRLGQLMMTVDQLKADYYNDIARGFINSHRRSDIGLHLATGLMLNKRLDVGLRLHLGCRNTAYSSGIIRPTSRVVEVLASAGWWFK